MTLPWIRGGKLNGMALLHVNKIQELLDYALISLNGINWQAV